MSFRNVRANNIAQRATLPNPQQPFALAPWVRNPSWPAVTTPTTSEDKVVGLFAVWPDVDNFFAISAAPSSGGYTTDYGDGSGTVNTASGVQLNYNYSYSAAGLAGTDGPVTFTDTGDLVNRTAHGYTDGMTVQFYNIVSTTGITEAQVYYVINAAADTFQISTSLGGSAVALTTDGSATLLPYKIATVTITPTTGGSTFNTVNLTPKHNQSGLQNNYCCNWLEMLISSTVTAGGNIQWAGSGSTVTVGMLENLYVFSGTTFLNSAGTNGAPVLRNAVIRCNQASNFSLAALFSNCNSLTSVSITTENTGKINNTSTMFSGCASLPTVPLFDTSAVTEMNAMFNGCRSLKEIPQYNTGAVTNMSLMFLNCSLLNRVPLLNTISVTGSAGTQSGMSSMFSGCESLTTVPLFNTANVVNMANMFANCTSIITVPQFNTGSVTGLGGFASGMSTMFSGCTNLLEVPLFNTANVLNMSQMFQNCTTIRSVPLLDTSSVENMYGMFSGCKSLTTVPLFDTGAVTGTTSTATGMASMFLGCVSLNTVPQFNTSAVKMMSSMFSTCTSLTSVPLFDTGAVTNMASMFTGCSSLSAVPLFNTALVTTFASMFNNCISLETVPLFDTSAATGTTAFGSMFNSCSVLQNIPDITFNRAAITTNASYTSMFASCRSLSRISSGAANTGPKFTFTVANCRLSSAQLDALYTSLPTVTSQTITVTGNYGTTGDTPSIATAKGWTVTGS